MDIAYVAALGAVRCRCCQRADFCVRLESCSAARAVLGGASMKPLLRPRMATRYARRKAALHLLALATCAGTVLCRPALAQPAVPIATWHLSARIVAVGLPDVAGVRQVGRFHAGGPIPGNPEFLLQTDPGRVLDPQRLLVAVASNFGAPLGTASFRQGAVLSIDPRGMQTLVIPGDFAAGGGQARLPGGAVQLYTAQSPGFLNARYNSGARTANQAAAAGPRYISVNNAFGRPWFANAPLGIDGAGSISVVDPDGAPLANAPSDDAGGVFAGSATARRQVPKGYASTQLGKALNYRASAQLTPGALSKGALGTAFLGASPDGSGFAVFAAATADGAITQVHVQDGVDGLAPPGSVARGDDPLGVIGMAFQWNPQRVLFVADAAHNRLLLLHLDDDERQFKVARSSTFTTPLFNEPVDLAPAVPEVGSAAFASHTTLAGDSDLYVVNRGDGSLLRMSQRGAVLARAVIDVPGLGVIGAGRLRAIAVAANTQRLWLTVQGELPGFAGHAGALIEVSAFDAAGSYAAGQGRLQAHAAALPNEALVAAGARVFQQVFAPATGLGPLFNERSCAACHPGPGGASTLDEHFARRVARIDDVTGRATAVEHPNSPVARRHSIIELGSADAPRGTLPREANLVSLRMPPALFAIGAIDRIDDASIEAQAVSKGDGIKGRVNYVQGADGSTHVGRWGWKADIAKLDEMVADAFANELGITSVLAARPVREPKDDGRLVRAVSAFLRVLRAPARVDATKHEAVHKANAMALDAQRVP